MCRLATLANHPVTIGGAFARFAALRHPEHAALIQRVLAIPPVKVLSRRQQGALSVTGL